MQGNKKSTGKNRATITLIAFVSMFALSLPVFAQQGEAIGNFVGKNTQQNEEQSTVEQSGEQIGSQLITLSGGDVTYDPDADLFYRVAGGSSFGVSVPDGAIVTGTVKTEIPPALTAILYKNGTELSGTDLTAISGPGKYVLAVTANDDMQTVRVGFTIVTSPTCSVKEYRMPADFYVVSATLDGDEATYSQTNVDMSRDGTYVINYRSPEAEKEMILCVKIDHTAPTVTLNGVVDGKANQPVTVSDVEEGAKIYLTRNGVQIDYTGTVADTGGYILTVQDEAGNETIYDFVVVTYANSSMKVLLVVVAVLFTAVVGYLIYYRKYIRVS